MLIKFSSILEYAGANSLENMRDFVNFAQVFSGLIPTICTRLQGALNPPSCETIDVIFRTKINNFESCSKTRQQHT